MLFFNFAVIDENNMYKKLPRFTNRQKRKLTSIKIFRENRVKATVQRSEMKVVRNRKSVRAHRAVNESAICWFFPACIKIYMYLRLSKYNTLHQYCS